MDGIIYISRRCEHCHELLILLHKNKDSIKIPVVDVDTKPYPKSVRSVPCMVIEGKVLPGVELFKFLDYLIKENVTKKEAVENKNERVNDLMPGQSNGIGPQGPQGPNGQPSQMRNLNQPPDDNNKMQNKSEESGDLDLPGFCIGGVCDLGFSSLEGDDMGGLDNFEYLEGDSDSKTCNLDNTASNNSSTKSEKAKQVDDDYARLMQERGNIH